jgi:hypothetical protein
MLATKSFYLCRMLTTVDDKGQPLVRWMLCSVLFDASNHEPGYDGATMLFAKAISKLLQLLGSFNRCLCSGLAFSGCLGCKEITALSYDRRNAVFLLEEITQVISHLAHSRSDVASDGKDEIFRSMLIDMVGHKPLVALLLDGVYRRSFRTFTTGLSHGGRTLA